MLTTALIFGASGFCARHLARRLSKIGQVRVIGTDIHAQQPMDYFADYFPIDICDARQVADMVKRVQPAWIFNLAGLTGGEPRRIYSANFMGVINLLEAVREHAPETRVLLIGSAAEYGLVDPTELPILEEYCCKPAGHYAVSKYAASTAGYTYARQYGLKVVVARPFNIVGAGIPPTLVVGAVISRARNALISTEAPVVKVGNLETERDYIAVEDAVEAYIRMIQGEYWGEIFNICSGKPRRILDIVEMALSHSPRPVRLEVDTTLIRPADVHVIYGSYEKARRTFGFEPVISIEESLKCAWNYEMSKNDGGVM